MSFCAPRLGQLPGAPRALAPLSASPECRGRLSILPRAGVSGLASNRPAPAWRERARDCSCEGPVRHGIRPRHHRGAAAAGATEPRASAVAVRAARRGHHAGRCVEQRLRHGGSRRDHPGRQEQADRRAGARDRRRHPSRAPTCTGTRSSTSSPRGSRRSSTRTATRGALEALPGAGPRPAERAADAVPPKTQTRYAEVRALVGGVTGIQGASGASSASSEPSCATSTSGPSVRTGRGR